MNCIFYVKTFYVGEDMLAVVSNLVSALGGCQEFMEVPRRCGTILFILKHDCLLQLNSFQFNKFD